MCGAELGELGVTHVEIGHAEHRRLFGKNDAVVRDKTAAALRNDLIPLLCVGETWRLDPMAAAAVVVEQVASAIPDGTGERILVGYEPVWAIGAAEPAPHAYTSAACDAAPAALGERLGGFGIVYSGSAGQSAAALGGRRRRDLFLGWFAHDRSSLRPFSTRSPLLVET